MQKAHCKTSGFSHSIPFIRGVECLHPVKYRGMAYQGNSPSIAPPLKIGKNLPKNHRKITQDSMPNMTGQPGCRTMEMNWGSSAPYLTCTPCAPLFCAWFSKGGNRRVFKLPGVGGDHFHCAVQHSPGHIQSFRRKARESRKCLFL